jgi:hypothetical protein
MELGDQANAGEIQERASVQHFLILGHPDPRSFNHAIAARYAEIVQTNYQSVVVRDLYAIGFDPLLKDIERPQCRPGFYSHDVMIEIDLIERSDVTFVYPLWFGTPPAIIKGYIDGDASSRTGCSFTNCRALFSAGIVDPGTWSPNSWRAPKAFSQPCLNHHAQWPLWVVSGHGR